MILYIQTAFLGDLLLSIPALKRLRQLYPDQKIHLLCRKNLGSLFVQTGLVDEAFDQFSATKPNLFEVLKTFSGKKYDLLVCPHESFRSTWISALISAKKKLGFSNFYSRSIFSQHNARPLSYPEVLRQLSLLTFVDPELEKKFLSLSEHQAPFREIPAWTSMDLDFYKQTERREHWGVKYKFDSQKKVVCLAPGSVWATKQWGVDKYTRLAQQLLAKGHQVVLVGSGSEVPLADQIESACPGVKNAAGATNLTELAEIIALSDVLVCNDSGAMHMASMTGTSTVSVFGPTVLGFGYQPWNANSVVVENKNLYCRPCSSHGGKVCPLGTHECMKSISAEQVLHEVQGFLP